MYSHSFCVFDPARDRAYLGQPALSEFLLNFDLERVAAANPVSGRRLQMALIDPFLLPWVHQGAIFCHVRRKKLGKEKAPFPGKQPSQHWLRSSNRPSSFLAESTRFMLRYRGSVFPLSQVEIEVSCWSDISREVWRPLEVVM